ncbi:Uncharacterised protein [Mycobacteroides abscessus subsp. abscessus]|nr:Uncharacterised protein [Mycobacteroides abscessus subsp. abscessus]
MRQRATSHVRAEHGELDRWRYPLGPRRCRRAVLGVGCRNPQSPSKIDENRVLVSTREERDTELGSGSVGFVDDACRDRQSAEVEQIAEVRVRAHPAVDADRVGDDLVDPWVERRGRHHQCRRVTPLLHRQRPELGESTSRTEQIDGGVAGCLRHDLRHNGIESDIVGVRCAVDELTDGVVTLGHEGVVVEQSCCGEEGRQVDGLDREARSLGRGHSLTEGVAPAVVELGEVGGHRNDRSLGRCKPTLAVEWPLAGCLRHHCGGQVRKLEVGGKDRRDVVVGTRGHNPVGGDRANGRLHADDPLQTCRNTARPCGVGTDRDVGETECDGNRRTGTRPAGDSIGTP